jgi:hypothetical protein
MATAIFDLTQRAAETWLRSSTSVRRELLDVFYSNRLLDEVSLCGDWRKPFNALAKTVDLKNGIPERRSFEPFAEAFSGPLPAYLLAAQRLAS